MCTLEECNLRVRSNEISFFERNDDAQQHYDPCRVISKYRRSAAGSFTDISRPNPRSLTCLQTTVRYLIHHILIPHFDSQTFLAKISFWEDRIRAVQVDLVRLNVTSKDLQYLLIQSHILIQYVLSDCAKYEHSFGFSALQTAFACYWSDPFTLAATDDEVLSYNILVQLNQQLQLSPENDSATLSLFWFQFTELYRKLPVVDKATGTFSLRQRPLLRWTVHIVFQCTLGYWQSSLSKLLNSSLESLGFESLHKCQGDRFLMLARCCMAPSIPLLRFKTLQFLNISCMKNESVSLSEISRLMCYNSNSETNCAEFCRSYGIPLSDNGDHVVLKTVPIQPFQKPLSIRNSDSTVLGTNTLFNTTCDGIAVPKPEWMTSMLT